MDGIQKCSDGVYRWVYELNLYRNPTILWLLWKIFGCIIAGLWLFEVFLMIGDHRPFWPGFLNLTRTFAIFAGAFLVFVAFGYFVYALIMGGRYCVLFEMDENGIWHKQMPAQFERAKLIGALTVLAGAAANRPGTMGTGILTASRSSLYSDFSRVRRIRADPGRHLIKVNARFSKNQVYVEKADYDFVLQYIQTRVEQLRGQ